MLDIIIKPHADDMMINSTRLASPSENEIGYAAGRYTLETKSVGPLTMTVENTQDLCIALVSGVKI